MLKTLSLSLMAILFSLPLVVHADTGFSGYRQLSVDICTEYVDSKNIRISVPKIVYRFMNEHEGIEDPEFELDLVAQKLNDNAHDLKCANGEDIVARAFSLGHHYTVMDDIFLGLLAGDEVNYHFNAVTSTYNPAKKIYEFMTVIDYIEKVELYKLEQAGLGETAGYLNLKKFTGKLRKYGARNYSELSDDENTKAKMQ